MITKILNSIEDFEDKIIDGSIKVCFLHENSKISKEGWAGFVKPEELYEPENIDNNLGISLIGSRYPGDSILTCIDIDGDKREINDLNIEQFSKDWAYKIITQKLDQHKVNYMAIQSSSGGYHIYLYTIQETLRYESTKGLYYPKTLPQNNEDITMFLNGHMKELAELLDTELPKSIVEIWCTKRYMVAPGSDIYDNNGNYIGTVKLLPDGAQKFEDITTLETNLNDIIREAFTENGFQEDTRQTYIQNLNFGIENKSSSSTLNKFSIQQIGNLITEVYPKIDGQKHTATLALGGYLYNKGINPESIQQLGEYIVNHSKPDLFKDPEAFIRTLRHDADNQDETRLQTGLPTFEEIFSPYYSKEIIGKKLHLATNPTFHKFWPNGRYSKKFDEIIINHQQNYIVKNVIQTKVTKEGELIDNKMHNYRIEHSIEGILRFDDISNPETRMKWEKPVQILFKSYNSPLTKSKIYQNPDELFKEYRKLQGVYTDHAKSIIEDIYREYESLEFIQNLTSSTKPGIWYDKKSKTLKKFIKEDGELKEVKPQKPELSDLQNGLHLLKQINDIYPWVDGKFGFFIKTALTMPYTDILKYHFDKHHPSIILHGEAGTLKTTSAELIVNFSINSFKNKENNIISGGELFSEYRLGRAMDSSSFPLVVNETEHLFSTAKIRELIKDSVTGKLIRRPGGNEPYGYYSHRASIYTMNTLPVETEDPAFLRRFIPIEFDQTERGDTPEMIEKLEFLNENGIKNGRFRELLPIGDFVFYLLNKNINWFNYSIEDLQDKIIHEMEQYSKIDLTFLKQTQNDFVYIDRTDQENKKLSMLLQLLRKPYYYNKNKILQQGQSPIRVVENILNNQSAYPYINIVDPETILIDIGLKREFNKEYFYDGTTITLKGCCSLLSELDLGLTTMTYTSAHVQGRKKQIRGIKMSIEDFTKILTNEKEVS